MNITQQAVFLCRNESFHRWLEYKYVLYSHSVDESLAAELLRDWCEIESRRELATNKRAAALFGELLSDFRKWGTGDVADAR